VFAVFEKADMRAKIHISKHKLGEAIDHPMVLPKDFVKALDKHRRLDLLLPAAGAKASKPILAEYWRRFRAVHGDGHDIFKICTPQQLEHTVPCKIHGDEGRSALIDRLILVFLANFFHNPACVFCFASFQDQFR